MYIEHIVIEIVSLGKIMQAKNKTQKKGKLKKWEHDRKTN